MPTEIIRIEYHDNPGLRYGNAEVVLDYIVRRPDTGGSIGLELSNSPHVAWRNNQLSGKINHKKSEFRVNYFVSHQDYYGMWRDNEERFLFMDGFAEKEKETRVNGLLMQIFQQALVIKNRKSTFSTLLSGSIPATSLIWITKERYSIWRSRKIG